MWIFIWVVLSTVLLGASFWSLKILIEQKKAWEKFALDKKFVLNKGTFMGSAEMNGMIGDFKFAFFTAQRGGEDLRSRRMMTVMEINLVDNFVDGAAMGTQMMVGFMQGLDKLHPFKIDFAPWNEGHYVFVRNDEVIKKYLTPTRIDALTQILNTKNADILVLFNDKEFLVRLETSDPMKNADKLNKIAARQMALMNQLRLTKEEREDYMAQTNKPE